MGVQHIGGRLPFVCNMSVELERAINKAYAENAVLEFQHGWTMACIQTTWDDIMLWPKLTKDGHEVWAGQLNLLVGDEPILAAQTREALLAFQQDFGLQEYEICVDEKVVQVT